MSGPSNRTFCPDCQAEMQTVRQRGEDVERCPWTRPGQTGACGKPFARARALRPDMAGTWSGRR